MVDPETTQKRITKLCQIYRLEPQSGLVLGAGVTCGSGVPLYLQMTLELCKRASNNMPPNALSGAVTFLQEQAKFLREAAKAQEAGDHEKAAQLNCRIVIEPEEVALFVKTYLADKDEQALAKHVKETLYDQVGTRSHDMVSRETFEKNETLDSVISFCAALPGFALAPQSTHRIETNPKVGGILTTNYDNLVEGAFGSKFGRKLLKPVGRVDARETLTDRRVIPVYHIHGYISYVPPEDDPEGVKASKMLVITENDYFRTFYDPLGFSNYIAMSFLRRFPCLFIGSSMKDRNIRRFLYHLLQERGDSAGNPNHFAIMKAEGTLQDDFVDAVLLSYGVATIWIKEYKEISKILAKVYISAKDVTRKEWEVLKEFKWDRARQATSANTRLPTTPRGCV